MGIMDRRIYYQCGYKYQLTEMYVHQLPPEIVALLIEPITTKHISVSMDGLMAFSDSYSFDGPSGPTRDTKTFMRGSLVHDGGFQLIREGALPPEARPLLDLELKRICLEDGMNPIRAWYVHKGVEKFGRKASIHNRDILVAP